MKKLFPLIIILVIVTVLVTAPPPQPKSVKGKVFHDGSLEGVSNGHPVWINNTNNSEITLLLVDAPSSPQHAGSFSGNVNGTIGDLILVRSWNSTNYGEANATLIGGTTEINVILNLTRPSEINLTLIVPINNSLFNITDTFNATVNVTLIGGSIGIGCFVNLSINSTALGFGSEENSSHPLGGMTIGQTILTSWNLSGNVSDSANLTFYSYCESDGINFDMVNQKIAQNITIRDNVLPVIRLFSPENNSNFKNTSVSFNYNVSDDSSISNCSLFINGTLNTTNFTVQRNQLQNFSLDFNPGSYQWQINCTDSSTTPNTNISETRIVNLVGELPTTIPKIILGAPVDLIAGGNRTVYCNATVEDENGASDIISANATLFDLSIGINSPDDLNDHYSNSSCEQTGSFGDEKNFSCKFDLTYFANNASWACNVTAYDTEGDDNSSQQEFLVNELLAVTINPNVIDFGNLPVLATSNEVEVNLTNHGNIDINVTLFGFGENQNDNISMNCSQGVIPVGETKYEVFQGQDYKDMINLTSESTLMSNFTLAQKILDNEIGNEQNQTFWRLRLPSSIGGVCNGTIVFNAIATS